ncbi:hypothetical protein EW146_g9059 [Bondarzewia mesenterica]|uniref:Uncharacterized protein n=1 Tax=Bondarzewia mesenterica TaxID=1095465 RepID=A0A4S4L9A0_9AGAM|nr:hypothetical protein EW146_g9059 [Bondarzewia mesenterica]
MLQLITSSSAAMAKSASTSTAHLVPTVCRPPPFTLIRRNTAPYQTNDREFRSVVATSPTRHSPLTPVSTPKHVRPSLQSMRSLSSPTLTPARGRPTSMRTRLIEPASQTSALHRHQSHKKSESFSARARRAPPPSAVPSPKLFSTEAAHVVEIPLPCPGGTPFSPEMVTISVKKGARIHVIADAWHLEENCHFEWQLTFSPRTVNMTSLRAELNDARTLLTITVRKVGHFDRMYA